MKKKLGYGSLSLLLVVIALLWGCTFNGFCLGDQVLALLGMSGCSSGAFRIHYLFSMGYYFIFPPISSARNFITICSHRRESVFRGVLVAAC